MLVRYAYINKPEVRYTTGGNAVFKCSIAVKKYNSKEKKADGIPAYYDLELWGADGEALGDQVQDGDKISIEKGVLSSNSYEKDGKKFYRPLIQFPEGIEVHKKRESGAEIPF